MKTLSVTLICKNEKNTLPRLLPSLKFADELIVVDTGSTDDTVQIAKRFTDKVYNFVWCDDFSKARNYAISKATCDYVMWLDADDILPPSTQNTLMGWKNSSDFSDVYYLKYRMEGQFPFWFWRERIVRRCKKCRFQGFIHEAIVPFGNTQYLDCEIVHHPEASHEKRNLQIYQKAIERGKRFTLRDKYYYARTLYENGQKDVASPILNSFARNARAYAVDRVDAFKLLANIAISNGQVDSAVAYLADSVKILPPNGEICCLFGECYCARRDFLHASQWYKYALHANSTYGFVNEYYNKFLPNLQLSVCLWYLGDINTAKIYHKNAKAICPTHPTVVSNDKWFDSR